MLVTILLTTILLKLTFLETILRRWISCIY